MSCHFLHVSVIHWESIDIVIYDACFDPGIGTIRQQKAFTFETRTLLGQLTQGGGRRHVRTTPV